MFAPARAHASAIARPMPRLPPDITTVHPSRGEAIGGAYVLTSGRAVARLAPMPVFSRGFRGRREDPADQARLPPGQYLTRDFPVLSAGPTPRTPQAEWDLTINGAVEAGSTWSWDEMMALPQE